MNVRRNLNRVACLLNTTMLATFMIGCATVVNPKPQYPTLSSAAAASVLTLENKARDSRIAPGPFVKVTIDGFSPLNKEQLVGGQYLPKGATEIRLSPGSHILIHTGSTANQYYFNPVEMAFDTESGKTYAIRFKKGGSLMKACYLVAYEGWSNEQIAQWPTEVCIANPLFGR